MAKKIGLLLIVLIPCIWALSKAWNYANQMRWTTVGWNSRGYYLMDSLNEFGFRGKTIQPQKDSTEKIILFIGDSQVEANDLPFKYMLENLVPKLLHEKDSTHTYTCYSIGSGGFGQDQEFLAAKEYFKKYGADKVLLWLTPENDVWNNIFPTHWPVNANPKPTYWIENGQLKGPNYQWLQQYPDTNKPLWKQPFFTFRNMDTKWESKLPPPYKGIPSIDYKGPLETHPTLGGDEAIAIEKSHYAIFLDPPSKRMDYGIQLTRFLLDSIQQLCKANHAEFTIFTGLNNEVTDMRDSSYFVEAEGKVYKLSKQTFFDNVGAITTGFPFHLFVLNTDWKQISRSDNHHYNFIAQQELAQKIVNEILLPDTNLIKAKPSF